MLKYIYENKNNDLLLGMLYFEFLSEPKYKRKNKNEI